MASCHLASQSSDWVIYESQLYSVSLLPSGLVTIKRRLSWS